MAKPIPAGKGRIHSLCVFVLFVAMEYKRLTPVSFLLLALACFSLRSRESLDNTGLLIHLGWIRHHRVIVWGKMVIPSRVGFVLLLAVLPSVVVGQSRQTGLPFDTPLVLTQLPANTPAELSSGESSVPTLVAYGDGARIVVVHPDGTRRVLTADFYSACDPDVSFDAQKILFAGKRTDDDDWNIFEMEMEVEGAAARQITRDMGNCRSPCYQSTLYTIISPQPWYQLTFVSDAAGGMNEDGSGIATHLYSTKLDGASVRRLTYNLSSDFDPVLMWDGRILFASWQRSVLRPGSLGRAGLLTNQGTDVPRSPSARGKPSGRVGLFGVNLDGADYARFAQDAGKRIHRMPCVTADGLVVFVESDQWRWDGAGQLGCVTLRRPLLTYRQLTDDTEWLYHGPSPLPDGSILVSRRRPDGSSTHGVVRFDTKTGETTSVFDAPGFHDIQARLLSPRAEPDGRSSVVTEKDPNGRMYCLNVNLTDLENADWLPSGTAKRLRVLEGVPVSTHLPSLDSLPAAVPGSTIHGLPPLARRRVLGEIDVSEDGSFNIEVPANTPIELQTLDANGLALRTCSWIWAKNHEPRGCIGCHEDGELTPNNEFVDAVQRDSILLCLPPERRRTVDFRRNIMPVVQRKCVPCHGLDGELPRLDGGMELVQESNGQSYFNRAYRNLLGTEPSKEDGKLTGRYVHPGSARTSPLVWHLLDRNTSRPWDGRAIDGSIKPIPEHDGEPITDQERRTLIAWIDMGAMWSFAPLPLD